jgi:hypothetical protein
LTTATSYTKEKFESDYQPGGTVSLVTGKWTSRNIEKGSDSYGLGRWSFMVLWETRGRRILIVTAYRVCAQTLQSCGVTTATAQQFRQLMQKWKEMGTLDDPIPRLQFILDLQAWLEYRQRDGYEIILAIDANENITGISGKISPLKNKTDEPIKRTMHNGSLATLCNTCGLVDPLIIQHQDSPPPNNILQRIQPYQLYPNLI